MIAGLTCLWDRGATESMINRKHTKYYKRKMQSNKVECVHPHVHASTFERSEERVHGSREYL